MSSFADRRLRPLAVATVLAIALGLASVGVATAHATLVSSDPADGASLSTAPAEIRLVFTEEVDVELGTATLRDRRGNVVPGVTTEAAAGEPRAFVVRLPALDRGAYSLAWRMVDEVDLHVTSGTIVFGVGEAASAAAPAPDPLPDPIEAALRWLDTLALAVATGGLLLALASAGLDAPLRRRLVLLAVFGAMAGLGVGLAELAQHAASSGATPAAVLAAGFGTAWLARQVLLVGLLVALFAAVRRPRAAWLAVALVGALAVTQAVTGHVETGSAAERPLRTIALSAHLFAVWAWVGGLLTGSLALLPMLAAGRTPGSAAGSAFGRFWLVAAPSLAVLAVTGLYLAGQLVESLDALLLTAYGELLALKLGLVALAAVLGLRNAATIHDGAARLVRRTPLRRLGFGRAGASRASIAVEALAAVAVVLAAAGMSASPPARGPAFDPVVSVDQPPLALRADDLEVVLSLRPNKPGPNFVELAVYDTRKPSPAPIGEVVAQLVSPNGALGSALIARPLGQSRYEAAVPEVAAAGTWHIRVSISRPGIAATRTDVAWQVVPATRAVAHRSLLSDAPLAPLASTAAALLALVFAGLLAGVAIRHFAPRLPPQPTRAPAAAEQGGEP